MRKNKTTLGILIALLAIATYLYFSNNKSTLNKKVENINLLDTSSITQIIIRNDSSVSVLTKVGSNWMINQKYLARNFAVHLVLSNLMKLQVSSLVGQNKKDTLTVKIKDQSTFVGIYNQNKTIKEYYFACDVGQQSKLVLVNDDLLLYAELPGFEGALYRLFPPMENYWRDKIIFYHHPFQISSIAVDFNEKPQSSFSIENCGKGLFKIINKSDSKIELNVNPKALEKYLLSYRHVEFDKAINDTALFSFIKKQSLFMSITFIDMQYATTKLKIHPYLNKDGKADANYCYLIMNDTELLKAKYIDIDPLIKDITYFRNK